MLGMSTKVGHGLARVLGIELQPSGYPVVGDAPHVYIESDPTASDWIRSNAPTTQQVRHYVYSLFPFLHWIGFYNLQWFIGDLIAGKYKMNHARTRGS